jgi:hypothetical protein
MMPPIVTAMMGALAESLQQLRERITDVKPGPLVWNETECYDTVCFKLDGQPYQLPLKGRNAELVVGINAEADKRIAVRAFLDQTPA